MGVQTFWWPPNTPPPPPVKYQPATKQSLVQENGMADCVEFLMGYQPILAEIRGGASRKHQRQPNTQRPVWGADPPHGHCTHAQPPPPTNGARAQESQAGPGGPDSAPPMGGRPCPSASEVTRTRPPREERPCPGSRGRRASWRQRSAQRGGSIAHNAALQAKAGRGTQ